MPSHASTTGGPTRGAFAISTQRCWRRCYVSPPRTNWSMLQTCWRACLSAGRRSWTCCRIGPTSTNSFDVWTVLEFLASQQRLGLLGYWRKIRLLLRSAAVQNYPLQRPNDFCFSVNDRKQYAILICLLSLNSGSMQLDWMIHTPFAFIFLCTVNTCAQCCWAKRKRQTGKGGNQSFLSASKWQVVSLGSANNVFSRLLHFTSKSSSTVSPPSPILCNYCSKHFLRSKTIYIYTSCKFIVLESSSHFYQIFHVGADVIISVCWLEDFLPRINAN